MFIRRSGWCLLCCALTSTAASASFLPKDLPWVMTLSGGLGSTNAGQGQTLTLAPDVTKHYKSDNSSSTFGNGEFFVGVQRTLMESLQGQIGVAAAVASHVGVYGNIWDDADPLFYNENFNYKVRHAAIMAKGKLIGNFEDWPLLPWLSIAMGAGFNTAYGYTNTPIIYEAITSANFGSQTIAAFTYRIGCGLQRQLTEHVQMGLAYEFGDWGKSQLASAPGQTQGVGLTLPHIYTNALMLNVTFVS